VLKRWTRFVLSAAAALAMLSACSDKASTNSLDQVRQCAEKRFATGGGMFSIDEDSIAYSFQSDNGQAKVVVRLDRNGRPVSTFFEQTPYGSHGKLMGAAGAIEYCAAYGTGRG